MRRLFTALAAAGSMLLITASLALGAAPQAPIGGEGAHPHHVPTPAGCVDINAVLFEPAAPGLHRAAENTGPRRARTTAHPEE